MTASNKTDRINLSNLKRKEVFQMIRKFLVWIGVIAEPNIDPFWQEMVDAGIVTK